MSENTRLVLTVCATRNAASESCLSNALRSGPRLRAPERSRRTIVVDSCAMLWIQSGDGGGVGGGGGSQRVAIAMVEEEHEEAEEEEDVIMA